jgi:hypothetical protein
MSGIGGGSQDLLLYDSNSILDILDEVWRDAGSFYVGLYKFSEVFFLVKHFAASGICFNSF